MAERNPVIDFHVRLGPGDEAVPRLLTTMDECGVDRAVVCAGGILSLDELSRQVAEGGGVETQPDNAGVLAACAGGDGRLVPCYFANPYAGVERYLAEGADFAGLELSPAVHGLPLTDQRTAALAAAAGRLGHSVYVVCFERTGCRVADLVRLAARHPETVFVLGHGGVNLIDVYSIELVAPYPNVVLETSGGYLLLVREAVRRLGPERVLFGSEYPLQHPELELAKIRRAELEPAAARRVLWSNAHRVLALPEPAPALAG